MIATKKPPFPHPTAYRTRTSGGQMPDDGWVLPSERLPDNDSAVLCIVHGIYDVLPDSLFDRTYVLADYYSDFGFVLVGWGRWINPPVIAWRELPPPPEGVICE